MKNFLKDNLLAIIIVVVTFGGIILFSVLPKPSVALSSGIVAIISAVTGVLLTVLVTKSLLDKQSENEKDRNKDAKVFEEQLKIYKEFLSKLNEVTKAEKISGDHVKDLIFQISYVAMHTSSDRVNAILQPLSKVVQAVEEKFDSEEKCYEFATLIQSIVLELQKELYQQKKGTKEIDAKLIASLITNINNATGEEVASLPETDGFDKIEMQTYFWKELTKQLKIIDSTYEDLNYSEEKRKEDVIEYYARARKRLRYFGLGFEVYTAKSGRKVGFHVEIENEYYYGFAWEEEPFSDEKLSQIVKQVSPKYNANAYWAGWRWPDYSTEEKRHDLDFWKLTQHTGMKRLIDKSTRDELIKEIAQEMHEQITKFKEIAKRENL